MRFLLDENVHHGLLSFLDSLGHDAKLSPKGVSNGKVLTLAISETRTLITHDTDFISHVPTTSNQGVILVRIPPRNFEGLKSSMSRFLGEKSSSDLLANKLFLLFEERDEALPFLAEEFRFK